MKATRDFFGTKLLELADNDESIIVINCGLGEATRVLDFKESFPDRFFDVGIAEANAISIASGFSTQGLKPFVTSFGHFLTGKFLEIFQSIGLNNANVTLVGTHAGLAIGKDGPTQMGLRDIGLMRLLPNVRIFQPFNEYQTSSIMDQIVTLQGPKYLRLNRQPQEYFHYEEPFSFGKPDSILNGSDLLVIAQGAPTVEAHKAITKLDKKNRVGLISVSSLPLDSKSYIEQINQYSKILIIEDHYSVGGITDSILNLIAFNKLCVDIDCISVNDYGQSGDPNDLYERYNLDEIGIGKRVSKILND